MCANKTRLPLIGDLVVAVRRVAVRLTAIEGGVICGVVSRVVCSVVDRVVCSIVHGVVCSIVHGVVCSVEWWGLGVMAVIRVKSLSVLLSRGVAV